METIALGTTGRTTTRLGFGSSALLGAMGSRESLALLEAAFAEGIRHFDTAPLYGYGQAEALVGEFLARHPGACTVTTKFGIEPPQISGAARAVRQAAGTVLRRVPGLRARLRPAAAPDALRTIRETLPSRERNPAFTAARARASLERSLRALRTGRVDLWLLHEVHAVDLVGNDDLLRVLTDAVQAGEIGRFGVGSEPWEAEELLRSAPEYCPVVQTEWSALNAIPAASGAFRIHHRALSARFRSLEAMLAVDSDRARRWSDTVGMDVRGPGTLAALLLNAAAVLNPGSLLLFSSTRPRAISENVRHFADSGLAGPARRLYGLLREEFGQT